MKEGLNISGHTSKERSKQNIQQIFVCCICIITHKYTYVKCFYEKDLENRKNYAICSLFDVEILILGCWLLFCCFSL